MRGAISKEIDVVAGLHAKHQTGRLVPRVRRGILGRARTATGNEF